MPVGGRPLAPQPAIRSGASGRWGWVLATSTRIVVSQGLADRTPGIRLRRPGALQGGRTGQVGVQTASAGRPPGMRCSPRGAPPRHPRPAGVGRRVVAPPTARGLGGPPDPKPQTPGPQRPSVGAPHTAHRAGRHLHGGGTGGRAHTRVVARPLLQRARCLTQCEPATSSIGAHFAPPRDLFHKTRPRRRSRDPGRPARRSRSASGLV